MTSHHTIKPTRALKTIVLALALTFTGIACAQTPDTPSDCTNVTPRAAKNDCTQAHLQVKTIYLNNVSTQNEANEILVAVRNVFDPTVKVYLLSSKNAIVVATYPEEIARIAALIHELDSPRKSYSLTFTLKSSADTPPQHFTLQAADGQRVTLKQGSKTPVVTGTFGPASDTKIDLTGVQTQNTYLDVGMNLDITLNGTATGAVLKSKIEQSAVTTEKSLAVPRDPIIRQTVLEGVTALTLNKPATIGSIGIPGTTHHMDIEVTLEQVH